MVSTQEQATVSRQTAERKVRKGLTYAVHAVHTHTITHGACDSQEADIIHRDLFISVESFGNVFVDLQILFLHQSFYLFMF